MATVWDVLGAIARYDGSPTAHKDVVDCLIRRGHKVTMSDAWCTMTVMAALYDAGAINQIGGYQRISGDLKKQAEKHGIWKSGRSDILPGDIVVYGRNGRPNHTELCVGYGECVSGNYAEISKDTCARRSWLTRSTVMGRVRPKYDKMPTMDNLQLMITAIDVALGVYGKGSNREKTLSVYGDKNAKSIQDTVDDILKTTDKTAFAMAVYIIQGRAGKDAYRKKRLGKNYTAAQDRVEDIFALRGHSNEEAAADVIADKYGRLAVRTALLRWNGYDPKIVQEIVDERLLRPSQLPDRVRLYAPRFWENDPEKYGDESIFLQYDSDGNITHSILFDTGMSGSNAVNKLQELPLNGKIDAVVLSHDHGDHTGNFKTICDKYEVGHAYFPAQTGVAKYQKKYSERMAGYERHAKNKGIPVTYCKTGDSFTVGSIICKMIFLADADKLPDKDNHHFINNMSGLWRITIGEWKTVIGGDLSSDGIKQALSAGVNVSCDVYKFQWHSDRGAITTPYAKALKPLVGYTQYHSAEKKSNGRKSTHNLLRDTGALVVRSYEDGDIYIDFFEDHINVTTSKNGISKTFRKRGD